MELDNDNSASVCPKNSTFGSQFTYLLNIDIVIAIIDDDNIVIVSKSKNWYRFTSNLNGTFAGTTSIDWNKSSMVLYQWLSLPTRFSHRIWLVWETISAGKTAGIVPCVAQCACIDVHIFFCYVLELTANELWHSRLYSFHEIRGSYFTFGLAFRDVSASILTPTWQS